MEPKEHLKMMRLLFLCLLLLLPAATVLSLDDEGSADGDDEDLVTSVSVPDVRGSHSGDPGTEAATENADQFTMIVIIVAVAALTLSIAAIATIMLVRRHMHNRQQGIYSVPTEQDHKGV